jgi:hypothetical protein
MEGGASKGSTGAVAWASLFLSWLCLREEERKQQRKEKERRKEKKKRKKRKKNLENFPNLEISEK